MVPRPLTGALVPTATVGLLKTVAAMNQFKILCKKGTHREKKRNVLTLTLMLVRGNSACKTSAGSSKTFRWLPHF